jgi:hypothetical protein
MVKHIVFFKLSGYGSGEEKNAQLKKMDEIFSPLGRILPWIVEFKTGINFTDVPHAWDFVIDSVFRSKKDLDKYMESPEHVDAVNRASVIQKTKAVVDYEF